MQANHRVVFTTLCAVALLSLAPPAVQASSHHRQGPPFAQMDADGDGYVSESEFTAFRAERMQQRAAAGKPMRHANSAPAFADIDADGDGRLTEGELTAMHEKRMAQMQAQGKGKGMGKGMGHGMGNGQCKGCGGQHGGSRMATFDEIDANGDGCIDRAELNAHHAQRHGGGGQDMVRP